MTVGRCGVLGRAIDRHLPAALVSISLSRKEVVQFLSYCPAGVYFTPAGRVEHQRGEGNRAEPSPR